MTKSLLHTFCYLIAAPAALGAVAALTKARATAAIPCTTVGACVFAHNVGTTSGAS